MTQSSVAILSAGAESASTLSDVVREQLRADIVAGDWGQEQKLSIKDLVARYGVGASPMREALHHLAGEGVVTFQGQRGFAVPPMSLEDLEDLIQVRLLIEETAVRQTIANGDDQWEADVVAALHLLEKKAARVRQWNDEETRAFEAVHKTFHRILYAGAASARLRNLHSTLFDEATRYRRACITGPADAEKLITDHRELARTILSRDVDAAVASIRAHLDLTREPTLRALQARSARHP